MPLSTRIAPLSVVAFLFALSLSAQAVDDPAYSLGPIDNPGMQVVVGDAGVQTHGYHYVPFGDKPTSWMARWVWLPAEAQVGAAACFRKEVTFSESARQVRAWISADTKYRLWINGHLVSRGPVDIGRDYAGGSTGRWFYDTRDLTPFFHRGVNVIAAEVFSQWPVGSTVSSGHPGLRFEAEATFPTAAPQRVASDGTWHGIAARQFPSPTVYDANQEIVGWRTSGFDEAHWFACVPAGDHWPVLVASEIPPLMECRYPVLRIDQLQGKIAQQADGSLRATGDGSFRVVFDRVLSAYPTLMTHGGRGGHLTINANYRCDMVLADGEHRFEFPYMTEVVPAYTVTLSAITTPVEISEVGAIFTSQPVEYRGAFSCSDDGLNAIWKAARWAVQICMQTHHLDSPNHQEPICDPGDYVIESMVADYAFHQPWLTRQDLRKFAWLLQDEKYHNFHTSYSLGWLQMLMDYYDFTGDRSLVEELAPTVHALMDTYKGWLGKNGLISEAPNYMFMDWVEIGGIGCHHPPAVIGQGYLTALYYHGLDMASRVAQMMGDTTRVHAYAQLRSGVAIAFNRELWVADKGLYRDGKPFQTSVPPSAWLPADTKIETFSPHVNLLAVLYDLAPKDQQGAIIDLVLAKKHLNTQPWFMHWVFQAIDHAGRFDTYATSQMRRWHIIPETQSFHEMWDSGDLSHGWCSTPLVQMSGRVLGVSPSEPGFKRMAIRPELCDFTWAKGQVPTPIGDVAVSWTLDDKGWNLTVTVPAGSQADVTLPSERFDHPVMSVDEQPIALADRPVPITAGTHHFAIIGTINPAFAPNPKLSENLNQNTDNAPDGFESEVVKADLIHPGATCALLGVEEHCSQDGGGKDTSALMNGTTSNGDGGSESHDDGRTFRGYGAGDYLTFHLDSGKCPSGYDLTHILSFAGHSDERASQSYTLSLAFASAPDHFVPFAQPEVNAPAGGSIVRLAGTGHDLLKGANGLRAHGVVSIRFDFKNGPRGFDCYREFCVVGSPAK